MFSIESVKRHTEVLDRLIQKIESDPDDAAALNSLRQCILSSANPLGKASVPPVLAREALYCTGCEEGVDDSRADDSEPLMRCAALLSRTDADTLHGNVLLADTLQQVFQHLVSTDFNYSNSLQHFILSNDWAVRFSSRPFGRTASGRAGSEQR